MPTCQAQSQNLNKWRGWREGGGGGAGDKGFGQRISPLESWPLMWKKMVENVA